MIVTIVNQLAVPLDIGYPLNVTLLANGAPAAADTFVGGVSMADLTEGNVPEGDPAYKRLNQLEQNGSITMAVAADAFDTNVLDEANEV